MGPSWDSLASLSLVLSCVYLGVNPKMGGSFPQTGWFISWKTPMNKFHGFGGVFHPYFWFNTHILLPKKISVATHHLAVHPRMMMMNNGRWRSPTGPMEEWEANEMRKKNRSSSAVGWCGLQFGQKDQIPRDPITLSDDDWGVQSPPQQCI